ncbi:MAG: mitochondrial fission ELM1 family protein [Desulfobulbaceae bacterium]|nr:mitochondrial fission ELM1 family protein [Desulfobulbaceae bacterium]
MNTALQFLVISDNKPGHLGGTKGVIKSIEKTTAVHQTLLEVHIRLKLLRRPMRYALNYPKLLNWFSPQAQKKLLFLCYEISDPNVFNHIAEFDWILSTGGDTSFFNAWVARLYQKKNIYCSSLRKLDPFLFTLLITSRNTPDTPNKIHLPLAPSPIDRTLIFEQGKEFRQAQSLGDGMLWAVMLGGDGAGYRFHDQAIRLMAQELLLLAEHNEARLLITTSRRTGLRLERTLESIFNNHPSVAYTTYYNQRPEKVVARFLGAADIVFCSADSAAMITEAMAAGKPVYAMTPEKAKPSMHHLDFLQRNIDAQRIKNVSFGELSTVDITHDVKTFFHLLDRDPVTVLGQKILPWIK